MFPRLLRARIHASHPRIRPDSKRTFEFNVLPAIPHEAKKGVQMLSLVCAGLVVLIGYISYKEGLFTEDEYPIAREVREPRPNWQEKCEKLGFTFHSADGAYWNESASYRVTVYAADELATATRELNKMCLQAAEKIIMDPEGKYLKDFGIDPIYWPMIRKSWRNKEPEIYGRFDLLYDGYSPPKLLEFNADTPTLLLESGIVQYEWMNEVLPTVYCSQFNILDHSLKKAWKTVYKRIVNKYPNQNDEAPLLHLAYEPNHEEDQKNTWYMSQVAAQSGFNSKLCLLDDIHWNGFNFVDHDDVHINHLFKLYPWEWLTEDLKDNDLNNQHHTVSTWIEPPWKMVLSNKCLLVVLWEMFPESDFLLPAFYSPDKFYQEGIDVIAKPALGREGQNIIVTDKSGTIKHRFDFKKSYPGIDYERYLEKAGMPSRFVYQEFVEPQKYDGKTAIFGSWVIDGQPAGIVVREDNDVITNNMSLLVPHYVPSNILFRQWLSHPPLSTRKHGGGSFGSGSSATKQQPPEKKGPTRPVRPSHRGGIFSRGSPSVSS